MAKEPPIQVAMQRSSSVGSFQGHDLKNNIQIKPETLTSVSGFYYCSCLKNRLRTIQLHDSLLSIVIHRSPIGCLSSFVENATLKRLIKVSNSLISRL